MEHSNTKYLRSNVACKAWTEAQLQLLRDAQARVGNNWKLIAELYFPERNANTLKCKFNYLEGKTAQRTHHEHRSPAPERQPSFDSHKSVSVSEARDEEPAVFAGLFEVPDFEMDLFDFGFDL